MPSRSRIFSSARAARLIERLVCAAGLRRELDRSFCSFSRAARPAADRRLPCRELLGCGPRPSSASRNDSRRPEDGGSRYDRCRPRYPMAPCARALRCARERAHRVFFITPRAYNTRNRRNFIDEFMVQAVFEVRLSFTLLSSKNRTCRLLLVLGPRRPPGNNTRRVWRAGTMSSRDAELDAAPEVGPSAKAVASANAKRAAFHADLASGQWGALEKALGAARGPPVPCDAREIRAEVKRFLRLHGQAPGSAPFLLGFRALLEAQGGRTVSVAWRVDPATLTQSGGDAFMRDAVALLSVSCNRREDLETPLSVSSEGEDLPLRAKWLAFSPPRDLGDVDLYKLLLKLPDRKTLSHANPAGEIVADASLPADPPREVESIAFGGSDCTPSLGKRRHVCCMLFVVAVVAALAVATR